MNVQVVLQVVTAPQENQLSILGPGFTPFGYIWSQSIFTSSVPVPENVTGVPTATGFGDTVKLVAVGGELVGEVINDIIPPNPIPPGLLAIAQKE